MVGLSFRFISFGLNFGSKNHASQIHARCDLCGLCDGGPLDFGKRHRDGALRDQLMGLRPDLINADPKLPKSLGDVVGLNGEGAIARHLFAGFKH